MASIWGGANMFDWPMADRSGLETCFTNNNYILQIAWHLLSLWSMKKMLYKQVKNKKGNLQL